MYYNNELANSTNKSRTTWSIIKTITNSIRNPNNIAVMEIDGKITTHHQTFAEELIIIMFLLPTTLLIIIL
jgi:hypothetical protein